MRGHKANRTRPCLTESWFGMRTPLLVGHMPTDLQMCSG